MKEKNNETDEIQPMEYVVFYFGVGLGAFGIIATILNIMGLI